MTLDRYTRWVRASHALARIEQSLPSTVQWLGRLDVQHIQEDQRYLDLSEQLKATDVEIRRFSDHYTMSYLWVLESYKVLRAIYKQGRSTAELLPSAVCQLIRDTEQLFERVRIPLAKLKTAGKNKTADSHIFSPALNRELGIGWQVSPDAFITRRELSDAFLNVVERIQQSAQKAETEFQTDSKMSNFPETREELRAGFHQTIQYVPRQYAADRVFKGVTINLSKSGMCLLTFHQLRKGQQIKIESGLKVSEPATVCWVKRLDKDIFKVGVLLASRHS